MRVSQRQTIEHTVIIRALADKTIEAREPGLINLPFPLPSIPVLTPLLSPVVGGSNSGNQNSNTGTTTTAAAPPSTPTSGGDTGSSGGSTGGSSSGGTGDGSTTGSGTGDTGGGSSSGSTSPSGGDSSSGGTSSTSGGTASSGDSSSSGSTSTGTTSTTTGDGTTSPDGSQSSTTGGGSVLTSNGTVTDGGSGSSSSGNGNTSSSSASGPEGNTLPGGVANAGKIPSGGSGTMGLQGTHSVTPIGSPSSTNGAGGGSGSVGGGSSGSGSDSQSEGKHGLSGGAIAGVLICLLALLIGCFIFFVRRRTRSRRSEQANRWWFSRKRVSQTYGDRNSKEILPTGAQTARSSFATTVDHSHSNHSNPPSSRRSHFLIPPLPPMAEIGRANGTAPAMVIDTSYFTSANTVIDSRFSIGSGTSDNHSQYLLVHHRDSLNPELGTPMSVRPFSPSESFAFPKPPDPTNSRPSSSATLAMLPPGSKSLQSSSIPPTPGLPTLIVDSCNPINNVTDPFLDNNPFDDPATAQSSNGSTGEFAETEFICRPFHPTLPDELSVRPQDPVRVLQAFDDGWALVEKVRLDDPKQTKKEGEGEKGLIPIDCLRAPGQELPDFFAAKRVSSYAGSVAGSGIGFQAF